MRRSARAVSSFSAANSVHSSVPLQQKRKTTRLREYDYSTPGAYFVTLCTQGKQPLLGVLEGAGVTLSAFGEIVRAAWLDLPKHYQSIELDAFVVMPDHVHGILWIKTGVGEGLKPSPTDPRYGLSEIVRGFKTFSARCINEARGTPGTPVWQRGFHDRVVRVERELEGTRAYIAENPARLTEWGAAWR